MDWNVQRPDWSRYEISDILLTIQIIGPSTALLLVLVYEHFYVQQTCISQTEHCNICILQNRSPYSGPITRELIHVQQQCSDWESRLVIISDNSSQYIKGFPIKDSTKDTRYSLIRLMFQIR